MSHEFPVTPYAPLVISINFNRYEKEREKERIPLQISVGNWERSRKNPFQGLQKWLDRHFFDIDIAVILNFFPVPPPSFSSSSSSSLL